MPKTSFAVRALTVLWPAFLMAGVAEMLTFAVVDPEDLHGLAGVVAGFGREAIYSVTFLIFWALISTSAALTTMLLAGETDAPPR